MGTKVRVGAVSYLNTRPLVFGFEQGVAADRIELSPDVIALMKRIKTAFDPNGILNPGKMFL